MRTKVHLPSLPPLAHPSRGITAQLLSARRASLPACHHATCRLASYRKALAKHTQGRENLLAKSRRTHLKQRSSKKLGVDAAAWGGGRRRRRQQAANRAEERATLLLDTTAGRAQQYRASKATIAAGAWKGAGAPRLMARA